MDEFGRYYTEDRFSELLISQITSKSPTHILDLGVGNGSLLNAALKKWNNAYYSIVDIEPKNYDEYPKINFIRQDLLNNTKGVTLDFISHKTDIAICNPPYTRIKNTKEYTSLFKEIGFYNCVNLRYLTTDLLFLAFNLSLLKDGGQLGIILPDTLMTSFDFELFRKDLLKYDIVSIIELPNKIFKKTDAKTYILVLNNIFKNNRFVNLYKADNKGKLIQKIKVYNSLLIQRMDFTYNSFDKSNFKGNSLRELGAVIYRGNHSKKELLKKGISFFHTNDFNSHKGIFNECENIDNYVFKDKKYDILIARVGTRSIGNFCLIEKGSVLISDCVFKVSLPDDYVIPFFKALSSEYGKKWFDAYSHGVCAKLISKKDLLDFKIPL